MKVLVTGCCGFIGSHITDRLLNDGCKVIGIDCFTNYYSRTIKENNISNALENKNFEFIEADLATTDEYPNVDYVFHQAAQAGVRASWGNYFDTYIKNNIRVTQKLLEYYKDCHIKKFVFASSSSVYGNSEELPISEKSITNPISPYGVTKLASENLCTLYYENYQIPTISLRYFTVYGPRQRPDMGIFKFVNKIINGEYITVYGDGLQTRDFTYVEDIVEANLLAAKSNLIGEVFNIGGGTNITIKDLIRKVENIVGKTAKLNYIDEQKGDVRDTWADINKANKLLGWSSKTEIDKGLGKFIEWYYQQNTV